MKFALIGCVLAIFSGYAFVNSVHIWPKLVGIIPTGALGGLCVIFQLLSLAVILVVLLTKFWNLFAKFNMVMFVYLLGLFIGYLSLVFITYKTAILLLIFD